MKLALLFLTCLALLMTLLLTPMKVAIPLGILLTVILVALIRTIRISGTSKAQVEKERQDGTR